MECIILSPLPGDQYTGNVKKSLDNVCVFKNDFICILKAEININTTVVH